MIVGVAIALSIGMTLLAVISAEMDLLTGDYARSGIGLYVVAQGGKLVARLAGDTPGTIQNGSTVLAQVKGWAGVDNAVGALTWTLTRQPAGPRQRGERTELLSVIGVAGDPTSTPGLLLLDSGRWLRAPNDLVLGPTLARDKKLHIGDTLRLNGGTFTVVGVGKLRGFSSFGQDSIAYIPYPSLVQRAHLGNVLNVIALQTRMATEEQLRVQDLGDLSAWTPAELVDEAQRANASGVTIDWLLIVLTLAIAGLFVSTMLNHSVAERRAEFAVLRAIGVGTSWVVLTVALEALTITLAAGTLGVLISLGFGFLINTLVAPQYGFDSLYRADSSLFAGIFVLAAILGLVSGVLPARRAAVVDPVEVLREM